MTEAERSELRLEGAAYAYVLAVLAYLDDQPGRQGIPESLVLSTADDYLTKALDQIVNAAQRLDA